MVRQNDRARSGAPEARRRPLNADKAYRIVEVPIVRYAQAGPAEDGPMVFPSRIGYQDRSFRHHAADYNRATTSATTLNA